MAILTTRNLKYLVSSTYLSMMKKITPSGAFGFYVATTFLGWISIIFLYPEVTGLALEEIREVFKHGFGVKYSGKLRKERKLQESAELETATGLNSHRKLA